MTSFFLYSATITLFLIILIIGFKRIRYRTLLLIMCIFISTITLFFGLKPKGYRFVNQAHWLKERNGIVFTNIGMIYSEKRLGEAEITDSLIIVADVKPSMKNYHSRFITIIDLEYEDLFSVSQWKNDLIVSLHGTKEKLLANIYLPNAIATDTISRIVIGISSNEMWATSSNTKQVKVKRLPKLRPHFLEHGTLLIGYSASGTLPWHGELYRLALSGNCTPPVTKNLCSTSSVDNAVFDTLCTQNTAKYLFRERSGHRITNKCPTHWDLCMPLFPKIFRYNWPQPLTSIFPLSKYANRYRIIDPVINFLGFMPFGAIFYLLFINFRKSAAASLILTILLAFLTSAGIELSQVFIPTRVSQMIDIVLNAGGAGFGALLILIALPKRMKNEE